MSGELEGAGRRNGNIVLIISEQSDINQALGPWFIFDVFYQSAGCKTFSTNFPEGIM